jgi:hypothetical protein
MSVPVHVSQVPSEYATGTSSAPTLRLTSETPEGYPVRALLGTLAFSSLAGAITYGSPDGGAHPEVGYLPLLALLI